MNFKLLFIFSLALGTVFLDAIRLVEHVNDEIITICNLLLVNPATSAAGERSFSSARRLKTWLRSTMTQTRFSNLTILNTHKQRTDNLCLIDIANEFTALNDNRRKNFGTFKESDFKISE